VIKSTIRWARHVANIGETRGVYGFWWGNLKEWDHLEDPWVGKIIILRSIFKKWEEGEWTGSIWLRLATVGGLFETRNKTPSGSIKCGEILD
jgi:hypothetical protein